MSAPRASPIKTTPAASLKSSSLFPDHSPPLPSHQPSSTSLSSDDADPPTFDLPTTICVTSPLTLSEEFVRLSLLLSSTTPHWQARVHSLQCLSDLCQQVQVTAYVNFIPLLHQHRVILVSQLVDRRSAVVKQACTTLTAVSAALQRLLLPEDAVEDGVSAEIEEQRRMWVSLACQWVEHLLPNIPVTIKVISEATIAAFHALLAHIAPLPPPASIPSPSSSSPSQPDFSLLHSLISSTQHKHASAREHAYRALSTLLSRLPSPTLQQQRAMDASEAATIRQSIAAYKAMTADLAEPSSPLPFSPAAPAGSPLFHALEVALYRGCGDSDAKARGAARLALMEFAERGSEERGERVLMSMPVSGQKLYEREKQDRMLHGVEGGGVGGPKERKMSVRERMKAQAMEAKKKGEVVAKTITHSPRSPRTKKSTSGTSSPGRASIDYSMGRGDGAILTGGVIEEEVVVGEGVMDEPKTPPAKADAVEVKRDALMEAKREGVGGEVSRNVALFTRLLDLESPVLTERMQGLLHGDALELLVHFVVRLPPHFDFDHSRCDHPHLLPASPGTFQLSSPSPLRRRPPPTEEAELTAHRRSFNVMNLLCQPRPSPSLLAILVAKLPLLLSRLLAAFLPQSQANLYHTCAILTHLFTLPSRQPLLTLTSSPRLSSLFLLTFDHLHEGPVPSLILTVLTHGDDKVSKKLLAASLRKQDVLAVLASRICQPIHSAEDGVEEEGGGELARSLACMDFVQQLLDKVGTAEYLTSFLATIADAASLIPQLIDLVTSAPSAAHPPAQLSAASSLLLSLLSSVEPAQILVSDPASSSASSASEMGVLARKKIANPLFALKPKALAVMKARLADLCEALVREEAEGEGEEGVQLSAGRVKHFSSRRLGLLKLVTRACSMQPECCGLLSRAVWERLVDWFLLYEHHNFLLAAILSILLQLVQAAPDSPLHTDTLRTLLVDLKLVSRLIGAYHRGRAGAETASSSASAAAAVSLSSSSTALDSTILILCSHLRLTASLHPPSSFLFSHLSSHSQWRSFLPTLQHETLLQARSHDLPVSEETLFMRAIQAMGAAPPPLAPRGTDGIDIGSRFAYALGYEEEAKAVVGATGGSGRKARKKKNKAKKKAKARLAEEADEGEGDGEDDEQGDEGEEQPQPSLPQQGGEEEKVSGAHEERKSSVIASTK